MDCREFIKGIVAEGTPQVDIARKCKISQSTITKILYSETKMTLETIKKIADAYGKPISFFLSDNHQGQSGLKIVSLSKDETRLLTAFRNLDERRQERFLDTIEDMVMALKESYAKGNPGNGSKESNSGRS